MQLSKGTSLNQPGLGLRRGVLIRRAEEAAGGPAGRDDHSSSLRTAMQATRKFH